MARGWLKVENRKRGRTWVLCFLTTRKTDGKRVEHKVPVGPVREFPSESSAWKEVERQHLNVNTPDFRGAVKFSDLAEHYIEHELGDRSDAVDPKSHCTIGAYKRNLQNRLIPRWGTRVALGIEPLEIEQWLRAVKNDERLENPTLDKMRRVMSLVYKSGMRYGDSSRRGIEPTSLCPVQNHERIRSLDPDPKTGFRFADGITGARAHLDALGCSNRAKSFRVPWTAVARRGFSQSANLRTSHVVVWKGRFAEE